jgi:hypothetical protein
VLHGGSIRGISFFTCLHQPFAGEAVKFCGYAGNIPVTAIRTMASRNNGRFTLWVWAFRSERATAYSAIRLFRGASWVFREWHGAVARREEMNRSALGAVNTQEQADRRVLEISDAQTQVFEQLVKPLQICQQRLWRWIAPHEARYRGLRHAELVLDFLWRHPARIDFRAENLSSARPETSVHQQFA